MIGVLSQNYAEKVSMETAAWACIFEAWLAATKHFFTVMYACDDAGRVFLQFLFNNDVR
jgi:hypothetical protein